MISSQHFNFFQAIESAIILWRAYYLVQRSGAMELESFLSVVADKHLSKFEILHHMRFLAAIAPVDITCLMRSAALTYALRKANYDAHLIIGISWQPFASHAWVEVDGQAFSDSLRNIAAYQRMQVIPKAFD